MRAMARWLGPLLTMILVTSLLVLGIGSRVELPVRDFAMRRMAGEPARATVVVAIDPRSIAEIGPWPWDRGVLAEIVGRAASSEANAVAFVVPLDQARAGDPQLAREMKRIPTATVSPLAPELRGAATVARGEMTVDPDGIVRRFASNSVAVVAASIGDGEVPTAGSPMAPAFRTEPGDVPVVSATDVLWHRTPAGDLRNRIVFIGFTASRRPVRTPFGPSDAVIVHAAAAESFARGEHIRELPAIVSGLVAGLLVAALLRLRETPRRKRIAIAASLGVATPVAGFVLLATLGIAIPLVMLTLTVLAAGATTVL